MIRMGLREANQQFSKAIKAVKSGQEVVLTERGKPIAVIKPLPEVEDVEARLRQLERAGLLHGATRPGPMPPFKPVRLKGRPITETLREDRDSRW